MKSKYWYSIIAVIIVIFFGFLAYFFKFQSPNFEENEIAYIPEISMEYGIFTDSFHIEEFTIRKNEFLSDILNSLGATSNDISNVSLLDQNIFDSKCLKIGNRHKAYYSTADTTKRLCYWVYEKSPWSYSVFCFNDTFSVYHGEKEVERRLKHNHAEISSSLWNATVENDMNINVSMALSDIYAWTIDFFGLQKGDKFSVLYDELYVDSTFIGIGQIHAAQFSHADKEHNAFYFEQDSVGSYWDESGNSLKRAFLKAPLRFSRISSHFSHARRHPVLRIVRPHTGVDYAAPSGTPVMTIGEGTVIEKGYKGGGGNTIKIRHNSMYTTAYLHLSKFASNLKVGQRVSQGQLIGYVGSTGISTGPHLDFRVWKNGKAINPLSIESPPVEPIRADNKLAFDSIRSSLLQQLNHSEIRVVQEQNKENKQDPVL